MPATASQVEIAPPPSKAFQAPIQFSVSFPDPQPSLAKIDAGNSRRVPTPRRGSRKVSGENVTVDLERSTQVLEAKGFGDG